MANRTSTATFFLSQLKHQLRVKPEAIIPRKRIEVRSPAVLLFLKRNGIYRLIAAMTKVIMK